MHAMHIWPATLVARMRVTWEICYEHHLKLTSMVAGSWCFMIWPSIAILAHTTILSANSIWRSVCLWMAGSGSWKEKECSKPSGRNRHCWFGWAVQRPRLWHGVQVELEVEHIIGMFMLGWHLTAHSVLTFDLAVDATHVKRVCWSA